MYTFNLSRVAKAACPKGKSVGKKETPAGLPAGEDLIDIRPIDMLAKKNAATAKQQNQQEDGKSNAQGERTASQTSRSVPKATQSNYCPTYQVLERTNIQEKQIVNVQPLLEEFRRVSEEFNQQNLTLDEAETHARIAQFANLREIQNLKESPASFFLLLV